MIYKITQERKFGKMMEAHAREIIHYLCAKAAPFSLLCRSDAVLFDPWPYPEDSRESPFGPLTLFVIAGYTLESLVESLDLQADFLSFVAGFGQENHESLVKVPLGAILHIVLQDPENLQESVVFVNLGVHAALAMKEEHRNEEEEGGNMETSMEILLSHPENRRFKK